MTIAALAAVLLCSAAQDGRKPDDVLQRRDGGILVGRVLKMDDASVEILVNGEREPRRVAAGELMPYSIYRLRLERSDKKDAKVRMALGDYCMENGLHSTAVREFEEAAKLDKAVEAAAMKKAGEAHNADAQARFEEAKALHLKKDWSGANKILSLLISRYDDTPYAGEAQKLMAKIAAEIDQENKAKKEALADQEKAKKQVLEAAQQNFEKELEVKATELIEEAAKLWTDGLEHEAKNLSRADRSWKSAEQSLLQARGYVDRLLKSNDVDALKRGKELDAEVNAHLVRTYYRLGRMWAVELNYFDAIAWLNKAIRLPHDEKMDYLLNDLLLQISKTKIRERAAGRGY